MVADDPPRGPRNLGAAESIVKAPCDAVNCDVKIISPTPLCPMPLPIEVEREVDGRWLAEIPDSVGVLASGATPAEAIARAQALGLRVLADRVEHGEAVPDGLADLFAVPARAPGRRPKPDVCSPPCRVFAALLRAVPESSGLALLATGSVTLMALRIGRNRWESS